MNKRKLEESMIHYSLNKQAKVMHNEFISEDGIVKFDFMTSLQNIVVSKIAYHLWMNQSTQQNVVNMLKDFLGENISHADYTDRLENIFDNAYDKISQLGLPKYISRLLERRVFKMGWYIYIWIRQLNELVLNTNESSEYSAVDLISTIVWTPRGKIDCIQTARNILIHQHSCLSDDHKYKLACFYCLEEEIPVLAPNVLNPHYLDGVDIEKHPMVHFWTAHITGDSSELLGHCRNFTRYYYNMGFVQRIPNISINDYILQLLIKYAHINGELEINISAPVAHMWTKLSEAEKTKNVKALFNLSGDQDMQCMLLSSFDYEQQQDIFRKCSGHILVGIYEDYSWREYFLPLALHVWDIIDPISYLYIMRKIIPDCFTNNDNQLKLSFKKLWQKSSTDLKNYLFEHDLAIFQIILCNCLSWKINIDLVNLIFNDMNAEQKKYVMFHKSEGIKTSLSFIQNGEWDLFDHFIECTLSSKEDVNQFKKTLIEEEGATIALISLDRNVTLDKLTHFLTWVLKSE